ncbi:MAG TPA: hypothetical protein VEX15_10315 [Nocardioidaceae bacterium]|nr:hypothetical protein [Nocardioidaceae bacterium]
MRKGVVLATAVALLTVMFAWSQWDGGPSIEPSGDVELAPPMDVSLMQVRTAESTRRVAIRITNTGHEAFTVTAVRLIWPALPESAETPKDSVFGPGRTIDLSTMYGQPDCTGYPQLPPTPPAAEIQLADTDSIVTRPLDAHGQEWIERLYADECKAAALHAVADIRLLDQWTRIEVDGRPFLRGWLELDRVSGDQTVTVDSIFGSVLVGFWPANPGRPVAVLSGGQQSVRIPVLLGAYNRCDDHALAGATQVFLLSVFTRYGTTPAQRIIVSPSVPVRNRALDVVHDACLGA